MYKYGIIDMEFEWDASKEISNIKKHRVSFAEAVETFFDPLGFQMNDLSHSTVLEQRFYWIGKNKAGNVLTTWFTRRDKVIRIIGSAEWRKFRRVYYEATKVK